jgi:hypothetical protein
VRMTKQIATAIKRACREACGGHREVEIGQRGWPGMKFPEENDGLNFLLWGEDHDLCDQWGPDELVGQDIKGYYGWVALDLYCYNVPMFGHDPDDALDCNVYVLLDAGGKVVYASQDDLGHVAAINAILQGAGVPEYVYTD